MREFLLVLLITLPFISSVAQARSLTLGCSGTATNTDIPKGGVESDPEKENIVDMSIVVNLDERTVSGLWFDKANKPLPIVAVDANSVTFRGERRDVGVSTGGIEGTVDRITGHVDARQITLYRNGSMSILVWDLRCKPTTLLREPRSVRIQCNWRPSPRFTV